MIVTVSVVGEQDTDISVRPLLVPACLALNIGPLQLVLTVEQAREAAAQLVAAADALSAEMVAVSVAAGLALVGR